MQVAGKRAKLVVENGWLICPNCNRNIHLLRIRPDTEARNLQVFCRGCRTEIVLNIGKGQCVQRQCQ